MSDTADSYEDVVAREAVDDLIEKLEKVIDDNETEFAIIGTALTLLIVKWAVDHMHGGDLRFFAKNIGKNIVKAVEMLEGKGN
jgi:hypothetical protein